MIIMPMKSRIYLAEVIRFYKNRVPKMNRVAFQDYEENKILGIQKIEIFLKAKNGKTTSWSEILSNYDSDKEVTKKARAKCFIHSPLLEPDEVVKKPRKIVSFKMRSPIKRKLIGSLYTLSPEPVLRD